MKTSPAWLQRFFDVKLPAVPELVDALTFHVAEVEEVTDTSIDVKILPDRAGYLLCHRGLAYEVSAILGLPMKGDPLRTLLPEFLSVDSLSVSVDNGSTCARYMAGVVRGVAVGPSPEWLRAALESVGQRSINNIVDATNYVMLNIGQPLHVFDASRLTRHAGHTAIGVRNARAGETIVTLTGDEYELRDDVLIIVDRNADTPIGIAGIKGGKAAEITNGTTDLVIESANFDGTLVRRASQNLKLWTDASQRFQNRPSPELAAYGMRDILALVTELAGGTVEGVVDVYDEDARKAATLPPLTVTLARVNGILGTDYTTAHVGRVFEALDFPYHHEGERFTVTPPFERHDIAIPEDLVEEVGRISGYAAVEGKPLPPLTEVDSQSRFRGIERLKDVLAERGFTEISTQTFAKDGDVILANPLDQTKPALRTSLIDNMEEALVRAAYASPRVLGPVRELKLFEIGTIFGKETEALALCVGYQPFEGAPSDAILAELASALADELGVALPASRGKSVIEVVLADVNFETLGASYVPRRVVLGPYHQFSPYPFALRDIAVWTPAGTEEDEVENAIIGEAGDLLARIDLFDRFEKNDANGIVERISYAFRLVFESCERTLSDGDLNPLMEAVTTALNAHEGWQVR